MKKLIIYAFSFFFFLLGCQQNEDGSVFEGKGTLCLKVKMKSDIQAIATRTLTKDEETELNENCKIRIYDADKLIRKYQGISNIPDNLVLPSGEYHVKVTAGDSVAASFDKKFYEGIEPFTLTKGATVPVEVVANIANTVTKVTFAESLTNVFTDCQLNVSVKAEEGTLTFNADNLEQMGYFSLPVACDTLFCTFVAKVAATGDAYEHIDTIPFVKRATLYNLTYEYRDEEIELPDVGGGMLVLEVDATPIGEPIEDNISYYRRPVIKAETDGQALELTTPYYLETNVGSDIQVAVMGSSVLKQVQISSEQFPEFLNMNEQTFDLCNLADGQEEVLRNGGIQIDRVPESKGYAINLVFTASLIQKYSAKEGSYNISFNVVDEKGKIRVVDWTVIVSDAAVRTEEVINYEVWATKATLRGTVLDGREPQGTLAFRYRESGTDVWSFVEAERSESIITSKEVIGLKPGTVYEYQIMEGEAISSVTCTFITEKAEQLPNSGFEEWSGSKPMYVAASNQNFYWDTGNHGSSSFSLTAVDLTTYDSSLTTGKDSKYSAKLESKSVVGVFAAGNLFVGKFLRTSGTNGVLGWGRSYTSRPMALTGYIRYVPETVSKYAKEPELKNGDKDKGFVFIAVGDWDFQKDQSEEWPRVINTSDDKTFFKSNDPQVIGYGEKTWDDSTPGTGLIPFTIKLDYPVTNRIPETIIVVASASKYGDYFAGAVGSTMWLDDLKLIYDESELKE
jgi:hypothetical protein